MDERTPLQQFAEENKKILREYANVDRELVDAMRGLIKSPFYQRYSEALNKLIQIRADELMGPLGSQDEILRQEWVKGTMNGLILARDLPSITIATMSSLSPEDEE